MEFEVQQRIWIDKSFSTAKNPNKLYKSPLDCSEAFLFSYVDTWHIAFGSISKICSISQIIGTEY